MKKIFFLVLICFYFQVPFVHAQENPHLKGWEDYEIVDNADMKYFACIHGAYYFMHNLSLPYDVDKALELCADKARAYFKYLYSTSEVNEDRLLHVETIIHEVNKELLNTLKPAIDNSVGTRN